MAFLDDLLSGAPWLGPLLDQANFSDRYSAAVPDVPLPRSRPDIPEDQVPLPTPRPTNQPDITIQDILGALGKYGSINSVSGALGGPRIGQPPGTYSGTPQLPPDAAPAGPAEPPSIFNQPQQTMQTYGAGNLAYPVIGQPTADNIDISARNARPVSMAPAAEAVTAASPQAAPALGAPALAGSAIPRSPDNLFTRLQAGAQNFTTGGNPIAGILNAIQGLAGGGRTDPTGIALQNQRLNAIAATSYLQSIGYPDSQAIPMGIAASGNPKVMEQILNPPSTPQAVVAERMRQTPGGAAQGMKAITELKAAESEGTKQGEARPGVEAAKATFDYTMSKIDELKSDPGLKAVVGTLGQLNPEKGPYAGTIARITQLKGQAIADVLASLHGLGLNRATQNELFAVRDGFARLDRAIPYPEYVKALDDLNGRLKVLRKNIGEAAGIGPTPAHRQRCRTNSTRPSR